MFELLIALTLITGLIQLSWLFLQLKSFKIKIEKNEVQAVSVVIAAKNELENLKKLISTLAKQNFSKDWEVIIVFDRCDDGSSEYLKNCQKDFQNLIYIEQGDEDIQSGESPKKSALLKAISKSKFPLILQTDADCYPRSEFWIEEMAASLKKGSVFVIGLSPYAKRPGFLNQLIQYDTTWTAASMIYFAAKGKPYMALGRNQLFEKDYFFSKGGYGESLKIPFGDDDLLIQNLNPQKKSDICVTNNGQSVSIPESNWSDWLNQKQRHLMAGKYYSNKILKGLILNYLTLPFYVLLVAVLLMFPEARALCLGIFVFRIAIFSYLFRRLALKSGSEINIVLLPLLDLLHLCINLVLGLSTRLRKNIEWG